MPPRCLVAVVLLITAADLPAADDPLDAFPADTGVVLRLSSPTDLTTKTRVFLNKAAPQFALLADQLGPGLGSLIGNPTLAGIDAASNIYVAVLPRSESRPAVLFAVRASDASALKKAIGQGYGIAEYEDWVIYSLDGDAIKAVQALVGGEGTGIRGAIPESLAPLFREGEFAAFLNVPALRKAYQAQIDNARNRFVENVDKPQGTKPAAAAELDANHQIFKALLTVVEDANAVAGHIAIADDALHSKAVAVVNPDSASARFLAKQTPSAFPLLTKLPSGRPAYFAFAGDLSSLISASVQNLLAANSKSEELRESVNELQKFQFTEVVSMFELGDVESGVYRSISLTKVDRPEDFLRVIRQVVGAIDGLKSDGLQYDTTVKPEAETIEGVMVDVVTLSTVPEPNDERAAAAQRSMTMLFGPEGITERIAVVDGLFAQTTGNGMMGTAIKAIRGEASGDETAQAAAKAMLAVLDEQSNLLVNLDLPRLLGGGLQLAVEARALPLPIDPKVIEDVNLAPSYTGITVVAAKNEIRLNGMMPASQVGGLVDVLMVLQQAAPQRKPAE